MKLATQILEALKPVKSKSFQFKPSGQDDDGKIPRINGTLKASGKSHKGYFEYSDKTGLGFKFKPSFEIADELEDEWNEFTPSVIDLF